MSIKIDMTSPAVDRQISVLKEFPKLVDGRYRPVLKRDVTALRDVIQPNIPRATGKAMETFGSKTTGKAFGLKGQVGWYDKGDPYYPNVLEYGAAAHEIVPKKKGGWLRFFSGGTPVFVHNISHPRIRAFGFMAAGEKVMAPIIEADLATANDQIIADLAAI